MLTDVELDDSRQSDEELSCKTLVRIVDVKVLSKLFSLWSLKDLSTGFWTILIISTVTEVLGEMDFSTCSTIFRLYDMGELNFLKT